MDGSIFLFDSVKAAQEVAFALRGRWDCCNGVEFVDCDYLTLKLAAAMSDAEYCQVGDDCNIRSPRELLMFDFSDTQLEAIAAQMANCFNQELPSGGKSFWQTVALVAQDVTELQQLAAADYEAAGMSLCEDVHALPNKEYIKKDVAGTGKIGHGKQIEPVPDSVIDREVFDSLPRVDFRGV